MDGVCVPPHFFTHGGSMMKRIFPRAALILAAFFFSTGNYLVAQPPTMLVPNLSVRTVTSGLITPTAMAFLGNGDFLVLEKNTGRVRRVVNGTVGATVLDLAVNNNSERGLLGMALHPNFPSNPSVYLFWTCRSSVPLDGDPYTPEETQCND